MTDIAKGLPQYPTLQGVRLKETAGIAGADAGVSAGFINFLGVDDPATCWGFNVKKPFFQTGYPDQRFVATEPAFGITVEGNVTYGGNRQIEWNADFLDASGATTKRCFLYYQRVTTPFDNSWQFFCNRVSCYKQDMVTAVFAVDTVGGVTYIEAPSEQAAYNFVFRQAAGGLTTGKYDGIKWTITGVGDIGSIKLKHYSSGATGFSFSTSQNTGIFEIIGGAAGAIQIGNLNTNLIGFYGTPAVAKPTIVGSKVANPALASLLTALAAQGLLVDSTT